MATTSNDELAGIGSIAVAVIRHLQSLPPATEVSTSELADIVGHPTSGFGVFLSQAQRGGFLAKRIEMGRAKWRLGHRLDSNVSPQDDNDERNVRVVSANAVPSIFAFARERGCAPFSVAVSTDGRLMVERHGRLVAEFTDTERRMIVKAAKSGVSP